MMTCPTPEMLQAYAADAVSDELAAAIEEHVASCPACEALACGLVAPSRPLWPLAGPLPQVAGYEVLGELARGGMGRVFSAREIALGREVALKTLLPGADAKRFLNEARVTAGLAHPAIPPAYALSYLTDGSPCLAMKLVRGQTLSHLLRQRHSPKDDLPRLLAVFEQICQAVGFAHASGVIHRDLKPANVMVGEFGEVQVMDWGLARLLDQPQTGGGISAAPLAESQTAAGVVLGTPGFMAPEQARGEPADARADVFALGAILAAILVGRPAVTGADPVELVRRTAAGETGEVLAALDSAGADPTLTQLAKRCLAAQAQDRPANGREVAAAVESWRTEMDRRVRQAEAERAAALVRASAAAQRWRLLLGAGSLVLVALVVGVVGLTLGLMWARDAAIEEARAKEAARRRLGQVERNINLLAELLRDIDPRAEAADKPPVYEQLRKRAEGLAKALDAEAVADELAVARLRLVLANTLRSLGSRKLPAELLEKASPVYERELGLDDPDTQTALHDLGLAYQFDGKTAQAIEVFERLRRTMEPTRAGDLDFLRLLHALARAYQDSGKLDLAVPMLEQVYAQRKTALGKDNESTLNAGNSLGQAYRAANRLREALETHGAVLAGRLRKLSPEHVDVLTSRNSLGAICWSLKDLDRALEQFQLVLAGREKKLGLDHRDTLVAVNNLAMVLQDKGRLPEAVPLFLRARDGRLRVLEPDHPETINAQVNLGKAHNASGEQQKAAEALEQAAASLARRKNNHPRAKAIQQSILTGLMDAGRKDRADHWKQKWASAP